MNPSRLVKIASDITAALTMLSLVPYEMGQVADVFPPEVKKWGVIIGASSTLALRLIGRLYPQIVPAVQPPVTVLQQPVTALK